MARLRLIAFLTTVCAVFAILGSCSSDKESLRTLESVIPPDTIGPHIIYSSPPDGDTWVSITEPIVARFSEDIDPATVNPETFLITPDILTGRDVCRTEVACTASSFLEYNTTYEVRITTDLTDTVGNRITEEASWSFTTRTRPPAPQIDSLVPPAGVINQPVTIHGSGFDTITYNNTVWFGGATALVAVATDSVIKTAVPVTATTGFILIRNLAGADISNESFVVLPAPAPFAGDFRGTFTIIERFNTNMPDTLQQYITMHYLPSMIYLMYLDESLQPEPQRVFCDVGGSYSFVDRGVLLDTDDPNFTGKDCDTTLHPAGFYGSTMLGDTVYMVEYNARERILKEFRLVPF
ncbi:MAG: Ig-like domain-containing protein [Candidatus Zixiibacteriota bacterium]|nr:MAG: Ig-like domain-containing protein [candidate division Zixibacteria bacterium]